MRARSAALWVVAGATLLVGCEERYCPEDRSSFLEIRDAAFSGVVCTTGAWVSDGGGSEFCPPQLNGKPLLSVVCRFDGARLVGVDCYYDVQYCSH